MQFPSSHYPFFVAGPPTNTQFYPCMTPSTTWPVNQTYNVPTIYNGPFRNVIGEGEVSSVILPDGTVQLFFEPTSPGCRLCGQMCPHCPNQSSKGTWFIKNVNRPINLRMPMSPQHFGPSYNELLTLPPNPFRQMNQGTKFHSDRCTSTEDIRYFCQESQQRNEPVETPCCSGARAVCNSPCKCSLDCAGIKPETIHEGFQREIDKTQTGKKRNKYSSSSSCSLCERCKRNKAKKRKRKYKYSETNSSKSSSDENRDTKRRQEKARKACEKQRRERERERKKRELERKKRQREYEKEKKRRRAKEEQERGKQNHAMQTCREPVYCDRSTCNMSTCDLPPSDELTCHKLRKVDKYEFSKDSCEMPCGSSPSIRDTLRSAIRPVVSTIGPSDEPKCRKPRKVEIDECSKDSCEMPCGSSPSIRDTLRSAIRPVVSTIGPSDERPCGSNPSIIDTLGSAISSVVSTISSYITSSDTKTASCCTSASNVGLCPRKYFMGSIFSHEELKRREKERRNREKDCEKNRKKHQAEKIKRDKELQKQIKNEEILRAKEFKKYELEQKRSEKSLKKEQKKWELEQKRSEKEIAKINELEKKRSEKEQKKWELEQKRSEKEIKKRNKLEQNLSEKEQKKWELEQKRSEKEMAKRNKQERKLWEKEQKKWEMEQKRLEQDLQKERKNEQKHHDKERLKWEVENKRSEKEMAKRNKQEQKLWEKEQKKCEIEEKLSEKEIQKEMKNEQKHREKAIKKLEIELEKKLKQGKPVCSRALSELEQERFRLELENQQRRRDKELRHYEREQRRKARRARRASDKETIHGESYTTECIRCKCKLCPRLHTTECIRCKCKHCPRLQQYRYTKVQSNFPSPKMSVGGCDTPQTAKEGYCNQDQPTYSKALSLLDCDCESKMSLDSLCSIKSECVRKSPVKIIDISGDTCRDSGSFYNDPEKRCKESENETDAPYGKQEGKDCATFCEGPRTSERGLATHIVRATSGIISDFLKVLGVGVQCAPCPAEIKAVQCAPSPATSPCCSATTSHVSFEMISCSNKVPPCVRNQSCNPL